MEVVDLPTRMADLYDKANVGKYTNSMDPMGIGKYYKNDFPYIQVVSWIWYCFSKTVHIYTRWAPTRIAGAHLASYMDVFCMF